MKNLKNASVSIIKRSLFVALTTFVSSVAFAQGPPGPGDGSGNPPDGVPLDSNLNMIFLALGLMFAGYVVFKQIQKSKRANA